MQLLLRRVQSPSVPVASVEPTVERDASGELSRGGLVNRIMEINPTASEEYLGSFTDRSLTMYLAHLESVGAPRGASWSRPCDSPAIIGRESAE